MADATDVSLAPLQAAIVSRLQAQFPLFASVAFQRSAELPSVATPALLCELLRAEPLVPQSDGGSGQFACALRMLTRVVVEDTPDAADHVRDAALALATQLHQWGHVPSQSCGPISVLAIEPEAASALPGGRLAWRVEWSVPVLFGRAAWDDAGTPVRGFYSIVPEIGAAHIDAYRPLQVQP